MHLWVDRAEVLVLYLQLQIQFNLLGQPQQVPSPTHIYSQSLQKEEETKKDMSFFNRDLIDEVSREESLGIIEELRKAEKAKEQAEKEAQEIEKERKRLEEAKRESDKELERLRHVQKLQRQMALEEERRKLEEQQLQTKEFKRQAAKKEKEKEKQLGREIEQTQIKADHIDREFRDRLSSADSIQYYSGTAGQLTEQEMLDLLITRNKLEARLRKMDKAHKALEEASLDLDPSTKIRHKRVREMVVEDLQKVQHFLQSMREIVVISSDEEEEEGAVGGEPLKGQEGQEEQPSQAQKEMEANLISVLEEADTSEEIEGQPGGLTDRQLKGALIRRQYLRTKLL